MDADRGSAPRRDHAGALGQHGGMEDIDLNNGVPMPRLGFGVWQVADDEAEKAVTTALECGYRSIDTARLYQNEEGVGRALRASGIPREELFVTTKLWNDQQGYDEALRAFDGSTRRLGLETGAHRRGHPRRARLGSGARARRRAPTGPGRPRRGDGSGVVRDEGR